MTVIKQQLRVTGVEHRITPDKWVMSVEFAGDNRVASPQATPNLPAPVNADTGWQNMTLASGWANVGPGWHYAQYRREGTKLYLRGLIQRTGAGTAAGALIANLPTDCRPTGYKIVADVLGSNGDPVSGFRIDLAPNGDIYTKSAFGTSAFVYFRGVHDLD